MAAISVYESKGWLVSAESGPVERPQDEGSTYFVVATEPLYGRGLQKVIEERTGCASHYVDSLERLGRMLGRADEVLVWFGEAFDAQTADAIAVLRRDHPPMGLVVIANTADCESLQQLLAEGAGRFGFLLRTRKPDLHELIDTLSQVSAGRSVTIESRLLEQLLLARSPGPGGLGELSVSERQVLELIARGLRNAEIARRLYKSEKTIEKHVGQVFDKLGLAVGSQPGIDRRVTAARIYITSRQLVSDDPHAATAPV